MTAPALVVFDLAGTTVEDDGQVPAAFAAALLEEGIDATAEEIRDVRGSSKREAITRLIPDGPHRSDRIDRVYASFREGLARRYAAGVRAIQGSEEVFSALRRRGVRVALTTGFDRDTTGLLLDALGWTTAIADAIVCGDDVPAGRPAPYLIYHAMELTGIHDVLSVAVVGDTTLDLRAGANARVGWNIGVLSGAHDRETLASAPHTHLIPSVAALGALWPNL